MESASSSSDRGKGRELAFLSLCALDSQLVAGAARADANQLRTASEALWLRASEDAEHALSNLVEKAEVREHSLRLLVAVFDRISEIDALIDQVSEKWRVARMGLIERNLLRLLAAELSTEPKPPKAVCLAEATKLADQYGHEKSKAFVNAVGESLAARIMR